MSSDFRDKYIKPVEDNYNVSNKDISQKELFVLKSIDKKIDNDSINTDVIIERDLSRLVHILLNGEHQMVEVSVDFAHYNVDAGG